MSKSFEHKISKSETNVNLGVQPGVSFQVPPPPQTVHQIHDGDFYGLIICVSSGFCALISATPSDWGKCVTLVNWCEDTLIHEDHLCFPQGL